MRPPQGGLLYFTHQKGKNLMLYRLLLNYFRVKFMRFVLASVISKKTKNIGSLKKLSFIEYGLELVNAYLSESKKTKRKGK
jgi:hypothetical protein